MSWLNDVKAQQEVLALRRKALEAARVLIEAESLGMTPDEIELAACDLCDRQMKSLQLTEVEGEQR